MWQIQRKRPGGGKQRGDHAVVQREIHLLSLTSLCLSIALSVQRVCHLVICLVCVALLISTWRSDGTKTRRLKRLN